jgi:hypothetical protein
MLCLSLTSLEKFIKLLILDYGAPCQPVRIQLSIYKLFKQTSRQGSFFKFTFLVVFLKDQV